MPIYTRFDVEKFVDRVMNDPHYQESVVQRAREGKLHPTVEKWFLESFFGKPINKTEITVRQTGGDDLTTMSDEQLTLEYERVTQRIFTNARKQLANEMEDR